MSSDLSVAAKKQAMLRMPDAQQVDTSLDDQPVDLTVQLPDIQASLCDSMFLYVMFTHFASFSEVIFVFRRAQLAPGFLITLLQYDLAMTNQPLYPRATVRILLADRMASGVTSILEVSCVFCFPPLA